MLDKLLPATTPKLDALGTIIAGYLGQPYQDEMKGVAKALNTSLGIIAIANLGYEVSAFCTSIVAQATDGSVYHARNLDFGEGMGFTDILRNMVPWYDDRRSAAQAALNATGPDRVNPDTLLAVLSTKPVLNQMTTYSIVAQPKTADVFTHFVRYCALQAAAARACLISRCLPNQATTPAPPEDYRPLVAYIRPLVTLFTAVNACFVCSLCKFSPRGSVRSWVFAHCRWFLVAVLRPSVR